ncbi:hypothetical protein [Streptomyces gardneri]|uniref:hypothetical protein n=1 Tax=Streptomyces gardneri TaxID=66892 RepID=UPI0034023E8E
MPERSRLWRRGLELPGHGCKDRLAAQAGDFAELGYKLAKPYFAGWGLAVESGPVPLLAAISSRRLHIEKFVTDRNSGGRICESAW